MNPAPPELIWTDSTGTGRNRWALFRRSFTLGDRPASGCLFHLFADSRYRLFVNGITLGHGPARFFISAPEYDSYDLTPYLRAGRNVIAIIVNSYNAVSFHTDPSTGALCAWGVMSDVAGKNVNIRTDDGNWKAIESPGHEPATHYLSFALAPAECLDARVMPADWQSSAFDDSQWKPAIIRRECRWGELRPRSIPMLDESSVQPTRQLGTWTAEPIPGEQVRSLFVTTTTGKSLHTDARVAVLIHLHSSVDQEIILGSWWGKHWLNGQELKGRNCDDLGMRQEFSCHLNKGKNSLLVYERLRYDYFDFTLGVPEHAGLKVELNLGGPWEDDAAKFADEVQWPVEVLPRELGEWKPWISEKGSPFPLKQRGWRTFRPGDAAVATEVATPVANLAMAFLYEFPAEVIGRPMLDFTAPAGTIVDLFYTERLKPDGTADVYTQPWGIHMADRFITKEGRQQIHTFHPRGFKYLEVFVTGAPASFVLHDLAVTRANYPVQFVGEFECSDPMLNKIWIMGRDTQHACMEDAYVDCPWRERGLYAGDMLVQFPVALACFGHAAVLDRRCLELFLLSQDETSNGLIAGGAFGLPAGRHPDYSAIVLIALHDYWVRTGDVKSLLPLMPRVIALANGLASLKSADNVLLDGSHLDPYIDNCFMDKGGVNCTLNCFYQRGFHCVSKIFELASHPRLARDFAVRAQDLLAAIRVRFWDDDRNVFVDRLKADKPEANPSIPANVLPLLWDIASPAQARQALPWIIEAMRNNHRVPKPLKSEDLNVNAYFSFYALGTLYKFGEFVEAQAFIRREWGRMVDAGAWTCWEYFMDTHSRCHAWSAAPTWYLSTEVLGVQFPEPGNINRIKIGPHPGTLDWARGVYPHPAGPIRISWRREGGSISVQHDAPAGVIVESRGAST